MHVHGAHITRMRPTYYPLGESLQGRHQPEHAARKDAEVLSRVPVLFTTR